MHSTWQCKTTALFFTGRISKKQLPWMGSSGGKAVLNQMIYSQAAGIISPFPQPLQMGPSSLQASGCWLLAIGFVWSCQDLEHDCWHRMPCWVCCKFYNSLQASHVSFHPWNRENGVSKPGLTRICHLFIFLLWYQYSKFTEVYDVCVCVCMYEKEGERERICNQIRRRIVPPGCNLFLFVKGTFKENPTLW